MSIASKEARETRYWLLLLLKSGLIKDCGSIIKELLREVEDIINIVTKIVLTASSK